AQRGEGAAALPDLGPLPWARHGAGRGYGGTRKRRRDDDGQTSRHADSPLTTVAYHAARAVDNEFRAFPTICGPGGPQRWPPAARRPRTARPSRARRLGP